MLGLFTAKLFSVYISSEDIIKMVRRITVLSLNPDSKAPSGKAHSMLSIK